MFLKEAFYGNFWLTRNFFQNTYPEFLWSNILNLRHLPPDVHTRPTRTRGWWLIRFAYPPQWNTPDGYLELGLGPRPQTDKKLKARRSRWKVFQGDQTENNPPLSCQTAEMWVPHGRVKLWKKTLFWKDDGPKCENEGQVYTKEKTHWCGLTNFVAVKKKLE